VSSPSPLLALPPLLLTLLFPHLCCYGRLAVVSDVDDGGFALNVDKRVGKICRAISKQVQRSDAGIEVDVMHSGNELEYRALDKGLYGKRVY
jgi:hypothetical protein